MNIYIDIHSRRLLRSHRMGPLHRGEGVSFSISRSREVGVVVVDGVGVVAARRTEDDDADDLDGEDDVNEKRRRRAALACDFFVCLISSMALNARVRLRSMLSAASGARSARHTARSASNAASSPQLSAVAAMRESVADCEIMRGTLSSTCSRTYDKPRTGSAPSCINAESTASAASAAISLEQWRRLDPVQRERNKRRRGIEDALHVNIL